MIISFAWTWDAVVAGRKTVTRREWSDAQFERWVRAWRDGRLVHDAWTNLPFVSGARRGGRIHLQCCPYREPLSSMPVDDLVAEGGYWASLDEFIALFGGDPDKVVTVVRFGLIEIF